MNKSHDNHQDKSHTDFTITQQGKAMDIIPELETKDQKKLRKKLLKEDNKEKRKQKKELKVAFTSEKCKQMKQIANSNQIIRFGLSVKDV